jgi:hypothetical protein
MDIWSILRPFGIFNGRLVYFVVIWYIFPVLVFCTEKNLATLHLRPVLKKIESRRSSKFERSLTKARAFSY